MTESELREKIAGLVENESSEAHLRSKEDFNASGGELLLYELLAQLPDEYYVFHSTRWNEKLQKSEYAGAHRYIQWGEADFTIFHPAYGFINNIEKQDNICYN